jgi:hypothetical protein
LASDILFGGADALLRLVPVISVERGFPGSANDGILTVLVLEPGAGYRTLHDVVGLPKDHGSSDEHWIR